MRGGAPLLAIIFGAGASYDSSPLYPPSTVQLPFQRPPLTNQLFENKTAQRAAMSHYPEVLELVERIAPECRPGGIGFEAAMDLAWTEGLDTAGGRIQRAMQFMALRFYLRSVISAIEERWVEAQGGRSIYTALLGQVESWRLRHDARVLLVTFNYDTLLERSLRTLCYLQLVGMNVKGGDAPYTLVKVHGSVSWARDSRLILPTGNARGGLTGYHMLLDGAEPLLARIGLDVYRDDEIEFVDREVYIRSPQRDRIAFPSIAVPAATKTTFEAPPEDIERLSKQMADADGLLVAGWAAKDEQFREVLRTAVKTEAGYRPPIRKLMVIDVPGEAERIGNELIYLLGFNPSTVPSTEDVRTDTRDFAEAVVNGAVEVWLRDTMGA